MNYRTARAAHVARATEVKARKRLRAHRAEIVAAYLHACAKSKTRKRSVEKLMAERGYVKVARAEQRGTIDTQWVAA